MYIYIYHLYVYTYLYMITIPTYIYMTAYDWLCNVCIFHFHGFWIDDYSPIWICRPWHRWIIHLFLCRFPPRGFLIPGWHFLKIPKYSAPQIRHYAFNDKHQGVHRHPENQQLIVVWLVQMKFRQMGISKIK